MSVKLQCFTKSEMAKEIICRSIKLDSMLNTCINAEKFLSGLSDISESNYIFGDFHRFYLWMFGFDITGAVSIGYFNDKCILPSVVVETVEMWIFEYEEDMEWHIANLLTHNFQGEYLIFISIFHWKLNTINMI